MDIDADGSLGRAMSLSYAEMQGREAKAHVAKLEQRVARLELLMEGLMQNRQGFDTSRLIPPRA